MNKLIQNRGIVRENWLFLLGLCLCLYFTYHALQGERSVLRLVSLQQTIVTTSLENDNLKSERDLLQQKVVKMRPGSIDSDLLEERVRLVLGYKHPDEVVLISN